MRNLMVLTLLVAGFARAEDAARPATAAADVKWHPGHYVLVSPWARQESYVYEHFRGIQKFYNWKLLEPREDEYDFSAIRSDVEFLAKHDKRLVIQVQTKAFGPGQNCCPAYLQGPEFGGGMYRTRPGAFNPIIWDERVNRRLTKLYAELGKKFDAEEYVEAVVVPETAVTGDVRGQGEVAYTTERYAASVEAGMQALRDAFPHTVVIQYANLPVEIHQRLSDYAVAHGIGIGGPDIFVQDPLLNDPQKGVYRMYAPVSGVVPLGTAVQPEDYERKLFRGPVDPPTAKEFFEFGRDRLKLNYMFWSTKAGYFEKVQAMMKEDWFPKDEAGGLNGGMPESLRKRAPSP